MSQSIKQRISARKASPFLRVTFHPNGVTEVQDRVRCGGVLCMSHLLIGPPAAVDAVAAEVCERHQDAYFVAQYGQGEGNNVHMERVLHRPV